MTVLVCGEALYDVFVTDETTTGFRFDARIGGSAFNVALGLARLGRPVGLVTGVSTDFLGDGLVRALEREGVGTAHLKRTDAPTTLALVAVGEDGVPRYRFLGEGAADRQVERADLPAPAGFDALVFGCFSMLTKPTGDSFLALARAAAGRTLVVLDPNVRPTVEPDMARWRERVDAFAAVADIVKASAEDLEAMGAGTPEETARRWLDGGSAMVVVTRGAEGAVAHLAGGRRVEARGHAVSVVDTVGAGDAFLAALLAGLGERARLSSDAVRELSCEEARELVGRAIAAAALTCTRRGADLPDRASLDAFLPSG